MNITFNIDNFVDIIYEGLTKLFDKLGVAVDWAKTDIMPYIMDTLSRYRVMEIIINTIPLIVFLLLASCIFYMYKKSKTTKYYLVDSDYDLTFRGVLLIVLSVLCLAFFITMFFTTISLLKWIFVPEIKYYDLIKSLIG